MSEKTELQIVLGGDCVQCWARLKRGADNCETLCDDCKAENESERGDAYASTIEVGDVVELLEWPKFYEHHRNCYLGHPVGGKVVVQEVYDRDWAGLVPKGPTVRHSKNMCWPLKFCRLVSKGSGQGGRAKPSVASEAPVPAGTARPQGSPCPACSGSIHGPGRISDWNDKPIACPRCQFGKPKPEPEIAKPYHIVAEDGRIILASTDENPWSAPMDCVDCGRPTQGISTNDFGEFICSVCVEKSEEREANAARAALEKAQAEAKRLGIL